MLKVCSSGIPTSTKTSSKKNVSWERSEIPWKLSWKRSVMKLFFWSSRRVVFETLGKLGILSNSICSIYDSQLYWKPASLQMLLLSVKRLFTITEKLSVVKAIFNKVTEKNFVLTLVFLLALVLTFVPQSSASRNFEKLPFNQSYRLAVYRL